MAGCPRCGRPSPHTKSFRVRSCRPPPHLHPTAPSPVSPYAESSETSLPACTSDTCTDASTATTFMWSQSGQAVAKVKCDMVGSLARLHRWSIKQPYLLREGSKYRNDSVLQMSPESQRRFLLPNRFQSDCIFTPRSASVLDTVRKFGQRMRAEPE
jgi:hypothetical protein